MLLLIPAYIADLIFGDPEWFPHPVREMGKLINLLDRLLRGCSIGNCPRRDAPPVAKCRNVGFAPRTITAATEDLFQDFSTW